jgi:hypothetical protein
MLGFVETLPVRTRLPYEAWALAALVTFYSMVSTLMADLHAAGDRVLASAAQIW